MEDSGGGGSGYLSLCLLIRGSRTESASSSAFKLTFAFISFLPSFLHFFASLAGLDQRLRDRVRRRRGLLPRLQRNHLRGQRRERAPLHATPGADHAEKYIGHKKPPRNPERQREHLRVHAGV